MRSALEVRMWCFFAAHRLPIPTPDYRVRDATGEMFIDFAYPDRMLAIETDGKDVHTKEAPAKQPRRNGMFSKDRRRWQRLEALGWSVIKVTYDHLVYEADGLLTRLKGIYEHNPVRRKRQRGSRQNDG